MSFSIDSPRINFDSYLTTRQQNIYHSLSVPLQEIILNKLLYSEDLDYVEVAGLVLDMMKYELDKNLQNTRDLFFETLLKSMPDNLGRYLEKLLFIHEKDLSVIFFKCVSTDKEQYYSETTLLDVIDTFHQIGKNLNQPVSNLSYFPFYSQGGKELLSKIKADPNDIAKLLGQENPFARNHKHPLSQNNINDLLKFTLNFKEFKSYTISYLASLSEKNRLSMGVYISFLKFLQDDPINVEFTSLGKCKITALVLLITSNETKTVFNGHTLDDLKELLREMRIIYETEGEELIISFSEAPMLKKASLDQAIRAFKLINKLSTYAVSSLYSYIDKFSSGKITLMQLLGDLSNELKEKQLESLPTENNLDEIFARFAGKDPNVQFPLDEKSLKIIKEQYLFIQKYCIEHQHDRTATLVNRISEIKSKMTTFVPLSIEDILEVVAIGRLAIRNEFQVYLYPTQVLTVLGLLLHPNCIAQAKTGEGKTYIATLLSFVLLTYGKQIHVMSSSDSLAIRDQEEHQEFFRIFNYTTSHICENRYWQPKYFQSSMLYGVASDYMFAHMIEMLHCIKIFPAAQNQGKDKKRFAFSVVDEVDSLTIDTALNGARMSYPAETTYEWVYEPIFRYVKSNLKLNEYSLISQHVKKLKDYLQAYQNQKFFDLANQLQDDQLVTWLQSAYTALFSYREKDHYVIDLIPTHKQEIRQGIVIVDAENTGRKQHGMRWGKGIHEFVEMKHNLEVQKESVTPLSISNAVFFQMYEAIYGLTGTGGSDVERSELKEIFNITTFDAPTHKIPQRIDADPVTFPTKDAYFRAILDMIQYCNNRKQPILVLCKTINDTENLSKLLKIQNTPHQILNEIQQEDAKDIIYKAGFPGTVTVATNNAGRGTDVKLKEDSEKNGGLVVLITFYPDSVRVDFQARGRAGRQGQPGKSFIFLSFDDLGITLPQNSKMEDPLIQKHINEILVQKRQEKILVSKSIHITRANLERYVYSFVKDFYQKFGHFQEMLSSERFLKTTAHALNSRKLLDHTPFDLQKINLIDRQIAEEARKLFTSMEDQTVSWKILLKNIGGRISDRILNDFSLNFFQSYEKIIINSRAMQYAQVVELFKKGAQDSKESKDFFSLLKDLSENELLKEIKSINKQIQSLYDQRNPLWEKYLISTGEGVVDYLRDITNLSLMYLNNKVEIGSIRSDLKLLPTSFKSDLKFEMGKNLNFTKKTWDLLNTDDFLCKEEKKRMEKRIKPDENFPTKQPISPTIEEKIHESFFTENIIFEEKPLPIFQKGMSLIAPPIQGIRTGLPNLGNTCWLNATLKFLACSTYYDDMYLDESPQEIKQLQSLLTDVIFLLRSEKKIETKLYRALLNEVRKKLPEFSRVGEQQDAPEFLIAISRALQWRWAFIKPTLIENTHQTKKFPRLGLQYISIDPLPQGWGKLPMEANFQTHVEVTIPKVYNKDKLDLAELIQNSNATCDVRPDQLELNADQFEVTNKSFQTRTYFTCIPSTLMLYLKRTESQDGTGLNSSKIDTLVQLDQDGLISLINYDAVYKNINGVKQVVGFIPREKCYYCIGSAIVQEGNINGGHYLCEERSKNGELIQHDDENIRDCSSIQSFGTAGYFIRLDFVKKEKL